MLNFFSNEFSFEFMVFRLLENGFVSQIFTMPPRLNSPPGFYHHPPSRTNYSSRRQFFLRIWKGELCTVKQGYLDWQVYFDCSQFSWKFLLSMQDNCAWLLRFSFKVILAPYYLRLLLIQGSVYTCKKPQVTLSSNTLTAPHNSKIRLLIVNKVKFLKHS